MKVIMSDAMRKLRNDPKAVKELRKFIATGKLNESRTIKYHDRATQHERTVEITIVPAGDKA